MSARADAKRIVALVACLDRLAAGEHVSLGELAARVFAWDLDRVFAAVHHAVHSGQIARNRQGEITGPESVLDAPPANDRGAS